MNASELATAIRRERKEGAQQITVSVSVMFECGLGSIDSVRQYDGTYVDQFSDPTAVCKFLGEIGARGANGSFKSGLMDIYF